MDNLIITQMPHWVKITLNRPAVKNALNTAVLAALALVLIDCAADADCRAVLICGADGNFAAGADVTEIADKTSADAAVDPRKTHWAAIRAFPKPLVAAVDGYALGGGFELALMADFMVLGTDAKLGLPESNLGIIPGALVFTSVGSGLGEVFARGETPDLGIIFTAPILLPMLGLAVLAALPMLLKALRKRDFE